MMSRAAEYRQSIRDRHAGAWGGPRRRGAMLLEVIVSFGLLIFGMVMIGLQINSGLKAAEHTDLAMRAVMLVDTKLDELAANIIEIDVLEEDMRGDFGILYPGFTWRMEIEETDVDDFYMVTIQIGYNAEAVDQQIEDPDYEIDIDDEGTLILQTAYRLLPTPPDLDMARDFGLNEEELQGFLDLLSQMGEAQEAADVESGGPDSTTLAELLEDLLMYSEGGFDPRMLSDLSDEEFLAVSSLLEALMGKGNVDSLPTQIAALLGGSLKDLPGNGGGRTDSGEVTNPIRPGANRRTNRSANGG